MQTKYFLILIIFFFISCTKEVEKTEYNCQVDANLVNTFIQENQNYLVKINTLKELQKGNDCIKIENEIIDRLEQKSLNDKANKAFEDTLFHVLNLENFERLVSKKENKNLEIIRLIRTNFAMGNRSLLVIEGRHQKDKKTKLKSYELIFDDKCNTPILSFNDNKPFSKDCFEILQSTEKVVDKNEWNRLREEIILTEFKFINYSNPKGITICDGASYSILYSSGSQINSGIIRMKRDCPNSKTAIFLVADELIKINNDSQ